MFKLFENVGLKLIVQNDKEAVFVNEYIFLKYIKPTEETGNRHFIQVEYEKVFLCWESAWYKRYYTDEELAESFEDIQREIEIIQANHQRATYIDHLMKVEGFDSWWKTNVEFIETLLEEKARD